MYDPLHQRHPGQGEPYPDSYWAQTVPPLTLPTLSESLDVEVAIVGGGYTGLSTALHLARLGVGVALLEANQLAWGCSGRNAGFVLTGTGRLGLAQLQKRFGEAQGRAVFAEYQAAVTTVAQLIEEGEIDCEAQAPGYYKVAHSARWVAPLQAQATLLREQAGVPVRWLAPDELAASHLGHQGAHGALRFDDNFGVNPLKLAQGYARLAQARGARLFGATPVVAIESAGRRHRLITPGGQVTARHLVLAGGGYTPKGLHPVVEGRQLPVLSSVIVTQPFSNAELAAAGLHTTSVVMDTRALKYYYRRLPDGRVLFGGRGAISGKHADKAVFRLRLLAALKQAYPGLPAPRIDYAWSGWISVALDDLPRVHSEDNLHYALGYCGSGVAFSAQAGKRLAERIIGLEEAALPLYQGPLPRFPLAPLRRLGQWGYYHYGRLVDAL
ncbi:NAD(P)/FAD-dependent oxidoreductase [Ferrimonas balearica]|uniref:NAD(P)/FAD-dependent oxidoreductase n=1 Tax=Ferrimonas balearica TaxID=44012 RepID=UPI001C99949F|nr:FAD-dependent oxidoreductase [Ferrimonas balearica]MBY5992232.1 FAD-binding oxidoreductase [Ferrimonas balearica]